MEASKRGRTRKGVLSQNRPFCAKIYYYPTLFSPESVRFTFYFDALQYKLTNAEPTKLTGRIALVTGCLRSHPDTKATLIFKK